MEYAEAHIYFAQMRMQYKSIIWTAQVENYIYTSSKVQNL